MGLTYFEWEVTLSVSLSYLIYCIVLYLIAQFVLDKEHKLYLLGIKLIGYSILILTCLSDFVVVGDKFVLGMLAILVVIIIMNYLEPHRFEKAFTVYLTIIKIAWLIGAMTYILLFVTPYEFEILPTIYHTILLLGVFGLTWLYKEKKLTLLWTVIINIFMYMVTTYKMFIELQMGDGTVTLLWATYAIALLTISVLKTNKQLVSLALGYIILVAGKFVLIDLGTVSSLWKIIISMGFGTALLVLSYLLQPILKQNASE